MTTVPPAYILIQGSCGELIKLDISKYSKRVQKGLRQDYGFRPAPSPDHIERHNCPVCHKTCKAENGAGTQAAAEMVELADVHRNIVRVLAAQTKPATVREVTMWLDAIYRYKSTDNTIHSRLSELKYWKIVQRVELEGPTKETGTKYESSKAAAYVLDHHRAELVEKHNWQTWILSVVDNGASFQLEGFGMTA